MKIKILVEGPYSDFGSDPPCRAVVRAAGDEVDYPEWYAAGLIQAGMAEAQQEAGSRQQEAGSRQQAAGSRQQEAGSRKQVAGSRKQVAGSRRRG